MKKITLIGMIALLSACSDRAAPPAAPGDAATPAKTQSASPAQAQEPAKNSAGAAGPEKDAASSASTGNPSAASNTLSAEGIGSIRFGMTLAQAEQAVGGKAKLPEPFDPGCSMVRFAALPKLRFMVENGVVTRADAEPGIENAVGVAFGDTLAQIRASHPEAKVSGHKYDANAHYVSFPSADGRAAIILEESGGKVTKMRAGLQPAVAYVETCG